MAESASPVGPRLSMVAENKPESLIQVSMVIGSSITGSQRELLIRDVRGMSQDFTLAGNLANFQIKGKRVQDLPMPEGVSYQRPSQPCAQVVMEMVNPETGERTTATDSCQVEDLRQAGWVPAEEAPSEPVEPGPPEGSQQAGFSTGAVVAGLGAVGVVAAIAVATS